MKYIHKLLFIIIAWYLLLSCFYLGNFFGHELPKVNSVYNYLIVIPYFGFGVLIWSLFMGIGIVVIISGVISSILFFKKGKWLFFLCHLIIGLLGGLVFRHVVT
ncbi:hypothetical protein TYM08_P3586 [Marinicellulosiphila megalodicopiae]